MAHGRQSAGLRKRKIWRTPMMTIVAPFPFPLLAKNYREGKSNQ